jgi:hypothetical protein
MSLVRIEALSLDSAVQLDAEDNRTYRMQGGLGEASTIIVDMARVGDRLTITLTRPAAKLDTDSIHRQPAPTLEAFDKKVRNRGRK